MHLAYFFMAVVAGLAIAAPVGPIGVICIRRTLDYGFARGFASGLGAATADGCYGLIAAVSMTSALSIIGHHANFMNICSAILLFKIGIDTLRAVPKDVASSADNQGLLSAFTSTLILTLLNPMTVMSFVAVFAAIGVKELQSARESTLIIVLGVFFGSLLWWFFLCAMVANVRERLGESSMTAINRISGLVVIAFGLMCLVKVWT